MQIQDNELPKSNEELSKDPETLKQEGSKTDPQLTELDGLKKGGVEPHVHPQDVARDEKGKKDAG